MYIYIYICIYIYIYDVYICVVLMGLAAPKILDVQQ